MVKKSGSVPQSILGRSLRLMKTGATILAREVSGRVADKLGNDDEKAEKRRLDMRMKQAEELVRTLGKLKGAAMKAGQILSLEASDMLPREVVDILRQLHDEAPPLPFEAVEAILKDELGPERFARFEDLSRTPIAAASIGQVHAARLDGQDVVLKIQFPGVAKSIDSDLKAVQHLAEALVKLNGKEISLDEMFEELARGLKCEVDYEREAANLRAYRHAFAGDHRYEVPDVITELSTARVLTMTRVQGARLKDWLSANPAKEDRAIFASLVLDLIIKEFVTVGLVQTDPNYGNFLYRAAERRLVLLDFGAMQEYTLEFRQQYQELLRRALACDRDGMIAQAINMRLFDPREGATVRRHFADMAELIAGMYRPENQPFDFGDLAYVDAIREKVYDFVMAVEHSSPPKQIIFLNRKLGGMFHLLKEVGSAVDLTPFVAQALKTG